MSPQVADATRREPVCRIMIFMITVIIRLGGYKEYTTSESRRGQTINHLQKGSDSNDDEEKETKKGIKEDKPIIII